MRSHNGTHNEQQATAIIQSIGYSLFILLLFFCNALSLSRSRSFSLTSVKMIRRSFYRYKIQRFHSFCVLLLHSICHT